MIAEEAVQKRTRKALAKHWAKAIETRRMDYDWFDCVLRDVCEAIGLPRKIDGWTLNQYLGAYVELFSIYVCGIVPWVSISRPGRDQLGLMHSFTNYEQTAVRSGHKTSKSNSVAVLALWGYSHVPGIRVPMTSSSFNQVENTLWREVKARFHAARVPIGGHLYDDPQKGLRHPDGREIFGFSTSSPERAAGISAPMIWYMVDEASGVATPIMETIQGNRMGGSKLLLTGNPTKAMGLFYEAFTTKKEHWNCIEIDSRNTPNYKSRVRLVPGLATYERVQAVSEEYGEDSMFFDVRVAGRFPRQQADALFPLMLVESAMELWKKHELDRAGRKGRLTAGLDTARFGGDPIVLQPVRGHFAYRPSVWRNMTGPEIAQHSVNRMVPLKYENEVALIYVDVVGENGWSTVDSINSSSSARKSRIRAVPVDSRENARDEENYFNRKSEVLFNLRDWIREGGMIPENDDLHQQLVATVYSYEGARDRLFILKKRDERKLYGRSFDERDALALAVSGTGHTGGVGLIKGHRRQVGPEVYQDFMT